MIILILHKRKLSLTVFWWKISPDHVAGKPQNEAYDLSSDSPLKLLFLEKWNQIVEKHSIWMQLAVISVPGLPYDLVSLWNFSEHSFHY